MELPDIVKDFSIVDFVCSTGSNYTFPVGLANSKGSNSEHNTTTRFRSYHLLRITHSIIKTRQARQYTIVVLTRFRSFMRYDTFYNEEHLQCTTQYNSRFNTISFVYEGKTFPSLI
jgi:hypothetical protein